jgi:monovalent cation:proton antiporter-2 (CPA2) family protein
MHDNFLLLEAIALLTAGVLAVPLFKRLGLGSIIGYLAAGAAIGPWGLGIVPGVEQILAFSEMGVVLLLFVIGLELKPRRLWLMRRDVFGLGFAQVALTTGALGLLAFWSGQTVMAALVLGFGLALSSTAFALQVLTEKNELNTRHGRTAFAILLFQDLAVVPFLAVLPFIYGKAKAQANMEPGAWLSALLALAALTLVVFVGKYLARPIFRYIAEGRSREIFTAAALLIVLATAALMRMVGLSMALGAFVAGMVLAESEFRHQLEADIEPFRGLLLGLFFTAVGMSIDFGLEVREFGKIALIVLGVMACKSLLVYGLAKIFAKDAEPAKIASVLPQGGEFAFVLFGLAVSIGLLEKTTADVAIVAVTASMALTPLAVALQRKLAFRFSHAENEFAGETIPEDRNPVIIAGFGRVGQIVGKILATQGIGYTTLDPKPEQIRLSRQYGYKIYYGDASRADVLKAAGAEHAKLLVIAIDDTESTVRTIETAQKDYPNLRIVARARNRQEAVRLQKYELDYVIRETFESSLKLGDHALRILGFDRGDSKKIVADFKKYDIETLNSTITKLMA